MMKLDGNDSAVEVRSNHDGFSFVFCYEKPVIAYLRTLNADMYSN